MQAKNTRTFQGTYTSKDGTKHELRVRIFHRLALIVLCSVLVKNTAGCSIVENNKDDNKDISQENVINYDKELIEKIIRENPEALVSKQISIYTVEYGNSLSKIAMNNGTTVARLCELNGITSKTIIHEGQKIKIETITEKSELDKSINTLEIYLHDYLFNSEASLNSKSGNVLFEPLRIYLYGNPTSVETVDKNSLYGRFINSYIAFHELEEFTDEDKIKYIESLTQLSKEALTELDKLGSSVISYETFFVYMQNGNTKSEEVATQNKSIYSK